MTDFSSVERLMEFGLGIGLAQQMVNTMNYSMGNMAVPGVGVNYNQRPEVAYYAVIDNAQAGPINETELSTLIKAGKINGNTLMWTAGLAGWRTAREIPVINKYLALNGTC